MESWEDLKQRQQDQEGSKRAIHRVLQKLPLVLLEPLKELLDLWEDRQEVMMFPWEIKMAYQELRQGLPIKVQVHQVEA